MINAKTHLEAVVYWPESADSYPFGGKGNGLRAMVLAKLPVPPFFAVSFPAVVGVEGFRMSPEALGSITAAAERLSIPPWAVRSSAWGEDGHSASFAGLFHTILGVNTSAELLEAVRQCFESIQLPRVKQYCEAKGMKPPSTMTVIVQQFIIPRASGIAFVGHPILQDRSCILVEGNWGAGTTVVGGVITPDQWIVNSDANQVERFELGNKALMDTWRENTLARVHVPRGERLQPCLSEPEVLHLARLVHRAEAAVGYRPDIEWVCDDQRMYLVQCRPITKAPSKDARMQTGL